MYKRAVVIRKSHSNVLVVAGLLLVLGLAVAVSEEPDEMVTAYNMSGKIIAVDPGHGGFDPGAKRGDVIEKNITMDVSQKLAKMLSNSGSAVVMIREDDEDLADEPNEGSLTTLKRQDLSRRADKANQAGAHIFVSIHANADPSPRWRGAQTFYNEVSAESKLLAESIQEELTRQLGNTTRKALAGDYYITQHTKMPAVIIEVGFISNPEEAKLLQDGAYQEKVAKAIYSGIVKNQKK